jgi:hypothetical protein
VYLLPKGLLPAADLERWKDANIRSRRGYAERGIQYLTYQPSSGKANFVSSSSQDRKVVHSPVSVILIVRRSFGLAPPLNSLATSGYA